MDFKGDGKIDHTTVISSVDDEGLKYTAHSYDAFNENAKDTLERYQSYGWDTKFYIVRLKKEVPEHEEPSFLDRLEDKTGYYSERAVMFIGELLGLVE